MYVDRFYMHIYQLKNYEYSVFLYDIPVGQHFLSDDISAPAWAIYHSYWLHPADQRY